MDFRRVQKKPDTYGGIPFLLRPGQKGLRRWQPDTIILCFYRRKAHRDPEIAI
jgi:hypothetical protein